jgi:hypothetical protein
MKIDEDVVREVYVPEVGDIVYTNAPPCLYYRIVSLKPETFRVFDKYIDGYKVSLKAYMRKNGVLYKNPNNIRSIIYHEFNNSIIPAQKYIDEKIMDLEKEREFFCKISDKIHQHSNNNSQGEK